MPVNLFKHQQTVFDELAHFKNVGLFHDMGLGKTYTGSEFAIRYGKHIIVVCQKSKVNDWCKHFEENYHCNVIDLTTKKGFDEFGSISSDTFNGDTSNITVGVINYDIIFRRQFKIKNFTLILDESSEIQNDTNKRCKAIFKLNADHVILLTGTPFSKGYEKLWSQCHLLGWAIDKKLFLQHYCEYGYKTDWRGNKMLSPSGRPIKEIVGYKNLDRLKYKMQQYGASFLKTEDVIDLPTQTEIPIHIPFTKEYKKFLKDKIIQIDDTTLVGDMSTKIYLYKRYLCGAYNPQKLEALKDLINSTDDRLIIFYMYNNELEAIKSVIPEDRPVSEVNGHTKDLDAYEQCDNSITLCQFQSASKGLNLQKANKIIYFCVTNRSEDWQQSLKRIHRIGQSQPCFYYYLQTDFDKQILDVVKTGKDYLDYLYEGGIQNES